MVCLSCTFIPQSKHLVIQPADIVRPGSVSCSVSTALGQKFANFNMISSLVLGFFLPFIGFIGSTAEHMTGNVRTGHLLNISKCSR